MKQAEDHAEEPDPGKGRQRWGHRPPKACFGLFEGEALATLPVAGVRLHENACEDHRFHLHLPLHGILLNRFKRQGRDVLNRFK